MTPLNLVVNLVLGIALLILGRKFFWLFVGVIGFLVGANLAANYLQAQPEWVQLIVAIAGGLVGALLAVVLQRVAIALAGFFAGGYLAAYLLQMVGVEPGPLTWLPWVIGGIIGAVLSLVLFDWALIILSSLTGASLIVQALAVEPSLNTVVYLVLVVIGVIVQAALWRSEQRRTVTPSTV
jgi:hypothetical protein